MGEQLPIAPKSVESRASSDEIVSARLWSLAAGSASARGPHFQGPPRNVLERAISGLVAETTFLRSETPQSAVAGLTRFLHMPPGVETRMSTKAGSTWIDHWEPEDADFWQKQGKRIAWRNLIWSIVAENLGFSIWLIWSVTATKLNKAGFHYSDEQLFNLVAL